MRAASSPEPRADFTPSTYKCGYVDLPRMAEKAQRMVKESLDAFVSRDTALAREVCGEDSERSEEHTSELQSQSNLVCRLLLDKKKTKRHTTTNFHTLRIFQST